MPTNRHVLKEKVAAYASILLDGAYEAGGQDAVLEVRDQAERVIDALSDEDGYCSVEAYSTFVGHVFRAVGAKN